MGLFAAIKSFFTTKSEARVSSPNDRLLFCEDCQQKFVFDEGEQKFFRDKGFTDPKRCPKCRKKVRSRMRRRGRRGGGGGGGGGENRGGGDRQESRRDRDRDRDRGRGRGGYRNSVIDGTSPYADER